MNDNNQTAAVEALARLTATAVLPARGLFIAEAHMVAPTVTPEGEPRRGFTPYRNRDNDRVTHLRRHLEIENHDVWTVRADDRHISRHGDTVHLHMGGHTTEQHVDPRAAHEVDWAFWAGDWFAELIEPHRILGFLTEVTTVPGSPGPVLSATPNRRTPSPYDGAAADHITRLEIVPEANTSRISRITGHHADGQQDIYQLIEAHDRRNPHRPNKDG
ncbi:hypothetical protein KIK06_10375 [Nocardiopsis sp. EMB25]|uniref:hypothetical protein n=1 Tax=Nocardiopsis sp. EMB25 TaxID=2835867 RepID=UPI0022838EB5|nr:hypothetical protein [Nocardiopsis sp. EMB25]MCY9784297.1 hypothetical protein [Nocardiopsis sp. EMB25]